MQHDAVQLQSENRAWSTVGSAFSAA